jgi:hypothetical protein
MKEGWGDNHLALAWEYPGQALQVIPARFSLAELSCDLIIDCGATLDSWTSIIGYSISDLTLYTNDLTKTPDSSARLTNLLEGPRNIADEYGSRMKGWLMPPITGDYIFWISSNSDGEFWLSTNSDPANKVLVCHQPWVWSGLGREWSVHPEQKSRPISLASGQAYYYEVRDCANFAMMS